MGGLISALSGANGAASNAQGYYGNAAAGSNQGYGVAEGASNTGYQDAMNNVINATGSPAAQTFSTLEAKALDPQFKTQNKDLEAQLSAAGILNSGGAKMNFADLVGNQSATLSQAIAPLYSQAMSSYDSLNAQKAAANSGLYGAQAGENAGLLGQGAGAANTAYANANQQFLSTLEAAGSAAAGVPSGGGGGGGGYGGGGGGGGAGYYGATDYGYGDSSAP